MTATIVEYAGETLIYASFHEPQAQAGEQLVTGAALSAPARAGVTGSRLNIAPKSGHRFLALSDATTKTQSIAPKSGHRFLALAMRQQRLGAGR